jgi:proton glutamate symport protein
MNIFRSLVPSNVFAAAANGDILAIISFALLIGVFIVRLPIAPDQRNVILDFFFQLNAVLLSSIKFVVRAAPVCVFSMIAGEFAHRPDFGKVLHDLGAVIVIVIVALIIHAGVVYSTIYWFVTKKSPIPHYITMLPAVLTAFGTSSSAVTFPVTLQVVEEKLKVSPAISKFVLSLGSTHSNQILH